MRGAALPRAGPRRDWRPIRRAALGTMRQDCAKRPRRAITGRRAVAFTIMPGRAFFTQGLNPVV